jgi:hypothetical protein
MSDKVDVLVKKFKELDTTSISDALDRLGIAGGCQGILPQVPGTKAVGRAFTVRYRPCGVVKGTVGDFLDDVEPGQVVVLDNGGRTYCTVWGDIMTVYARKRGIACDTAELFRIGYAPAGWHNLLQYLKGRGYTDAAIREAGLTVAGEKGMYDMFRDRLMFPIMGMQGDVIAFGGAVTQKEGAKVVVTWVAAATALGHLNHLPMR